MNKCDLEETKHLALQKFVYLCRHSTAWEFKRDYSPFVLSHASYDCDGYKAFFHEDGFYISLAGVTLLQLSTYVPHGRGNQSPSILRKKAVLQAALEADPYVQAFRAMVDAFNARAKAKADEEACLKLQAALFPPEPPKAEALAPGTLLDDPLPYTKPPTLWQRIFG